MTWIVSLYETGGRNLLTASVTDGELVSALKRWAEERGLRVVVKEQHPSRVVDK